MSEIVCQDQRLPGGDGVGADLWLANSRLRAVLRHPQASLTLAGVGGGTLVDLAPWGHGDALLELAPLVDGGWLLVDSLELQDDAVVVAGVVRALPDRPDTPSGQRRTVTWRVPVDEPWLELEGADGLWLHPAGDATRLGDWVLVGNVVYGHDGTLDEDLGGALRLHGVTRVLAAPFTQAWSTDLVPTRPVSGRAPGATTVTASEGGTRLAVLRVDEEGHFEGPVPAAVDTLRAAAPGRTPSAPAPAGTDVELQVGPPGAVQVRVGWASGATPRPVALAWDDGDARQGSRRALPDGDVLAVGAGPLRLTVGAGPAVAPQVVDLVVPPDATILVDVLLRPRIETGSWVPADLGWPGGRSRRVRTTAAGRVRAAVAEGLAYVVATAEDDVGTTAAFLNDAPWIRYDDGAAIHHPDGWAVSTWPLGSAANASGGGVPRIDRLTPQEALRTATGGTRARYGRVDLAWLVAAATDPRLLEPMPDFVDLTAPGGSFDAWRPWTDLLDAGRFVRPGGPRHWLDVVDAAAYGRVEVERALRRGRLTAGTGGWITLDVGGVGPGGVVPPDLLAPRPTVRVQRGDHPLDRVGLLGPGGSLLAETTVEGPDVTWSPELEAEAWLAAVAWSTTTDEWSVTMPVWVVPPFLPETDMPQPDPPDTGATP